MNTPFLSSLGIPDTDQVRDPVGAAFPPAFNPNNMSYWEKAVAATEMVPDEPATNWATTIQHYVDLCVHAEVYPFSNLHQAANDYISSSLGAARKEVVKFFNRTQILKHVGLKLVTRDVKLFNNGFVLSVFGKATLKDPTFEQWLTKMPMPRFDVVKHDGKYTKQLLNGVKMVIYNEYSGASQRWFVGYEITVNRFPDLPGKHLPSRAEIERFIMNVMWLPVLRQHRPEGFHHRLI